MLLNLKSFSQSTRLIGAILSKFPDMNKARTSFIINIFMLFMGLRGKYTFSNMSRQGDKNEKTYRTQFSKRFNFLKFNSWLIHYSCSSEKIAAFDPCFIPKSGSKTQHISIFWSGVANKALPGLEIGGLSIVDIKNNTAMLLEANQTPSTKQLKADNKTLIDHYAEVIISSASYIAEHTKYLACDGYFAKNTFVLPVLMETDMQIISKFRCDANLMYIYTGVQKGRGRKKKYEAKVNLKDIDKSKFNISYQDQQVALYDAVLYSIGLKRNVRVVYVEFLKDGKPTGRYAVLFSTDLELDGSKIYKYYKSRFQIEFLFRDAKQHCGLTHCQARDEDKMHFHYNASLTTVSLAKALFYIPEIKDKSIPFSMADVKTLFYNQLLAKRIFSNLGFDPSCEKLNPIFSKALNFGRIAA